MSTWGTLQSTTVFKANMTSSIKAKRSIITPHQHQPQPGSLLPCHRHPTIPSPFPSIPSPFLLSLAIFSSFPHSLNPLLSSIIWSQFPNFLSVSLTFQQLLFTSSPYVDWRWWFWWGKGGWWQRDMVQEGGMCHCFSLIIQQKVGKFLSHVLWSNSH